MRPTFLAGSFDPLPVAMTWSHSWPDLTAASSGSGQTCSPRGPREAEGRFPDDPAIRSGQLWLQVIAAGRALKDPARKVGVTGLPAPLATRSAAVSAMISHGRSTTCGQYPAPARSGIDAGSRWTAPVQRQGTPMPWRLVPTSCQRRPCATAIPLRRALRLWGTHAQTTLLYVLSF